MASVFCSKYLRYLKKGISVLAAYVLECSSSAVSEPPSAPRPHCTALYCTCTALPLHCTVLHCGNVPGRNLLSSSAGVQDYRNGKLAAHKRMMPQPQSTVMSQGNNLGHNEAVVALPLLSENSPYIVKHGF